MKPIASRSSRAAPRPPSADRRHERELDKLWKRYRRRATDQARNALVTEYQQLVRSVVRRFAARLPRSVDPGDLETAANVGLMSAIESFDPGRGVQFESYCELRIRGALLDELRTQDWLPRPWRNRIERHKRVSERLRSECGREPTIEEVARGMEMSLGEYRQVFGHGIPGAPSGSMPSGEGRRDEALSLDVVPDLNGDAPGDKLSRDELLQLVAQKLSAQEYRIVYLKYWEELPMREIGQIEGLSESRVCKIHARLLERLKDRFRAQEPQGNLLD
jgi:RNA polymerase sigma factor for flagellar operon FliA